MPLYVITGGPGSGKTTVLKELEHRGYRCASEVARQIIQEQMRTGGRALPWEDRQLYTKRMLEASIASFMEHASGTEAGFSDRGIPDSLCYARLVGLREDPALRDACERYRYASPVFIAPPWPEIYENDSERRQDFAEAVRTHELMAEVYAECGYRLIDLPFVSPQERADFVVACIDPS